MRTYYTRKRAQFYNQKWKVFSEKTHAAVCSAIDFTQLREACETRERPPRILDAACGTGLLLERISRLIPLAELHGVDASLDMLMQARLAFGSNPNVHFVHASLQGEKTAGLPYTAASFDVITCTNALHNIKDPIAVLRGLTELLTPQGQFVLEDYARRSFPFPWRMFEWFAKRIDPQHIRAYTLAEAQMLCQEAGLHTMAARKFPIDILWRGWVIRTSTAQGDDALF